MVLKNVIMLDFKLIYTNITIVVFRVLFILSSYNNNI